MFSLREEVENLDTVIFLILIKNFKVLNIQLDNSIKLL